MDDFCCAVDSQTKIIEIEKQQKEIKCEMKKDFKKYFKKNYSCLSEMQFEKDKWTQIGNELFKTDGEKNGKKSSRKSQNEVSRQ